MRTTDGRPYGEIDLLRDWWHITERLRYVASAVPYGKIDLLRGSVTYPGKHREGRDPPLQRVSSASHLSEIDHKGFGRSKPPPYSTGFSEFVGERLAAPAAGHRSRCHVR